MENVQSALEIIKQNLSKEKVLELLATLGFTSVHVHANQIRSKCKVHDGNNPSSFCYSLENHMWHCHACGEGGDVVQLVEDIKELSFHDATKFMLSFVGIDDLTGIVFVKRPSRYLKELEAFKNYVTRQKKVNKLYTLPPVEVKPVTSFRKFTKETLDYFELGYFKEIPFETVDGTITAKSNRLGMPIVFDNKTLGYAFRKIKKGDTPKWLFQPAKLDKRNLIYNLSLKWYESIIICEGQFDVWAFHQIGLMNVGAVLGSSITEEQESLLTRCTSTIILSFDGDEAGIKATNRAIMQLKRKFDIYIIPFPDGKDACDLTDEELLKCYKERIHYTKWNA